MSYPRNVHPVRGCDISRIGSLRGIPLIFSVLLSEIPGARGYIFIITLEDHVIFRNFNVQLVASESFDTRKNQFSFLSVLERVNSNLHFSKLPRRVQIIYIVVM
jgi:hypothetical protein